MLIRTRRELMKHPVAFTSDKKFLEEWWVSAKSVKKELDNIEYAMHHTDKYTCWEEPIAELRDKLDKNEKVCGCGDWTTNNDSVCDTCKFLDNMDKIVWSDWEILEYWDCDVREHDKDYMTKKYVDYEWLINWLKKHEQQYGNLHVQDLMAELQR